VDVPRIDPTEPLASGVLDLTKFGDPYMGGVGQGRGSGEVVEIVQLPQRTLQKAVFFNYITTI